MKEEIKNLVEKARRSLAAAKELFNSGYFDFAASRAYYALFYVSEALLLTKEKTYGRHAAVSSAVYNCFVKDGQLPKEYHRVLCRAFDLRSEGDYLCGKPLEKEEVQNLMCEVEKQLEVGIDKLNSLD